jgi:hypothetical protein
VHRLYSIVSTLRRTLPLLSPAATATASQSQAAVDADVRSLAALERWLERLRAEGAPREPGDGDDAAAAGGLDRDTRDRHWPRSTHHRPGHSDRQGHCVRR